MLQFARWLWEDWCCWKLILIGERIALTRPDHRMICNLTWPDLTWHLWSDTGPKTLLTNIIIFAYGLPLVIVMDYILSYVSVIFSGPSWFVYSKLGNWRMRGPHCGSWNGTIDIVRITLIYWIELHWSFFLQIVINFKFRF